MLFFQALLPQAEAIAMPVQDLHLCAIAVNEDIRRISKRTHGQLVLHQRRQAVDLLAEIYRNAAQKHLADTTARMHQRTWEFKAWLSWASHCGAGT